MAALALGVVGAFIGSFIPGVGTAIGFALGPVAGEILHAPIMLTEETHDEEPQQ